MWELLSHIWLFVTPWTVACQAPLFMEFSRQEYWSGLPFHSPGDLPNPRTEPLSPTPCALGGRFSTSQPPGKPRVIMWLNNSIPYRYLRELKTYVRRETCILIFTEALFTIHLTIHYSFDYSSFIWLLFNSQKQKNWNVSWLKNGLTKYGISKQWNVIHS